MQQGINPEQQNWESQSEIQVGKLTIWVRKFEIITEFTIYLFHQNRLASSYDGC